MRKGLLYRVFFCVQFRGLFVVRLLCIPLSTNFSDFLINFTLAYQKKQKKKNQIKSFFIDKHKARKLTQREYKQEKYSQPPDTLYKKKSHYTEKKPLSHLHPTQSIKPTKVDGPFSIDNLVSNQSKKRNTDLSFIVPKDH